MRCNRNEVVVKDVLFSGFSFENKVDVEKLIKECYTCCLLA